MQCGTKCWFYLYDNQPHKVRTRYETYREQHIIVPEKRAHYISLDFFLWSKIYVKDCPPSTSIATIQGGPIIVILFSHYKL